MENYIPSPLIIPTIVLQLDTLATERVLPSLVFTKPHVVRSIERNCELSSRDFIDIRTERLVGGW